MELSWFPPRIFVGRENPSIRYPANRIEADQGLEMALAEDYDMVEALSSD